MTTTTSLTPLFSNTPSDTFHTLPLISSILSFSKRSKADNTDGSLTFSSCQLVLFTYLFQMRLC